MSSLTQKWLKTQTSTYLNGERTFLDVDVVLNDFNTLRVKSDVYTYDDGRTQLLLCVHGLLPIQFKGVTYNIPIAVWITRDYPNSPPIPYVVPTNDMLLKPGKHLDLSGRLDLEYAQNWQRKSQGCNLHGLLQDMQQLFSHQSPVYSKPKQHTPQTQTPPPFLPPKPPSSLPQQAPPQYQQQHRPPVYAQSHQPPPPPPPLPPQRPPSIIPSIHSSHHITTTATPSPPPPPPPPPPPHIPIHSSPAPTVIHPTPIPNFLDQDDNDQPEFTIDSPAPPPVRPPNPELVRLHSQVHAKLVSSLQSLSATLPLSPSSPQPPTHAQTTQRLLATQSDLLAGPPAIRDEMARLEAVRDVCRSVSLRLKSSVTQAESWLSDVKRRGDVSVDELVCADTIVGNQMINLVAEDNAIEDTVYQLHRALNTGRIDLERFLRTTRVLAEEQFMKKALIEKIEGKMAVGRV